MALFDQFLKRRSIKRYAYKLGPRLKRKYGTRENYTLGQISSTISDLGLNQRYQAYAWAMYNNAVNEDALKLRLDDHLIDAFRNEIATVIFGTPCEFTTQNILQKGMGVKWGGGTQGINA